MSNPSEPVAHFPTEAEARLAQGYLSGEGILSVVISGNGNTTVPPLGLGVPTDEAFRLLATPEDAERARRLLFLRAQMGVEADWEDAAELALDGWLCTFCDTPVALDVQFCPECGASRHNVRADDADDED